MIRLFGAEDMAKEILDLQEGLRVLRSEVRAAYLGYKGERSNSYFGMEVGMDLDTVTSNDMATSSDSKTNGDTVPPSLSANSLAAPSATTATTTTTTATVTPSPHPPLVTAQNDALASHPSLQELSAKNLATTPVSAVQKSPNEDLKKSFN